MQSQTSIFTCLKLWLGTMVEEVRLEEPDEYMFNYARMKCEKLYKLLELRNLLDEVN